MNNAPAQSVTPAFVYAAVSLALLLPVLFWPLPLWHESGLNPALEIRRVWLISGIVLLLCAVTADSLLAYRTHGLSPLFSAFWILLSSIGVSLALRWEQGIFILAACFAIHALRAATGIWSGRAGWWQWTAWVRDTIAALSLFVWSGIISHAG